MGNFNYTQKLQELYSEHVYTHHSGGIQVPPLTFTVLALLYFYPPINMSYFL